MTFADWLRNAKQHVRRSGWKTGGKAAASEFYTGAMLRAFDQLPRAFRDNIFDEEWDVCIVLDACRYDALVQVAPEYDWLSNNPGHVRSPGSMSEEWMQASFTPEYRDQMAETGHVTWNAYSNFNLDEDEWAFLDEVWKQQWDDDRGLLPPETVTERGIARWRDQAADRMVLHYMQPHAPYQTLADEGVIEPLSHERVGDRDKQGRLTVWKLLRRGEISHERAWEAYLDNLRWVLDDIDRLRQNLDAEKVVLTADHGDCFGEWGIYGHPRGVPAPELIKVPWVEIPAQDTGTVAGAAESEASVGAEARERLAQLGYVEAD